MDCSPDSSRTTFDDSATNSIGSASAPFVGIFRPQQPLSTFIGKSGTNVNGTWQLHVIDQAAYDVGTIQCWSLFLSPAVCTDGGGLCPGVDVAVGMTDTPNPVVIGSNLVYTITVTNFGPNAGKDVVMSQVLPASVIFLSAVSSQGSCSYVGGTVTCDLGAMDPGTTATINVAVTTTAPGVIFSTASVLSTDTDPDPSNNSATVSTRVLIPSSDLSVGIADAPDPVLAGGTLTYTVSVTNNGPIDANGVMLTNLLPASVLINSFGVSQGTAWIGAGNAIVCNLGALTVGSVATATIVVTPTQVGMITATAQVLSGQVDPYPANNTASTTTSVAPAADLSISLVSLPGSVVVSNNLAYLTAVTNFGPNVATNVVVVQVLPANINFVSATSSQGTNTRSGNSLVWNLGSLSVGGWATNKVVINSTNIGTLTTSATVSAGLADPNLSNNTATNVTSVARPFISIVAAGATLIAESGPTNGAVDIGETVTVSLRLRNAGNITNNNLVATLLATNGVAPAPANNVQTYGVLPSPADCR